MKILMLDSSTYGDDVNIDKYYELGEVKSYSTSTREEALKRVSEYNPEVVIINKIVADKEFIDAAPVLKMIAETATGYNNIDVAYAKEYKSSQCCRLFNRFSSPAHICAWIISHRKDELL